MMVQKWKIEIGPDSKHFKVVFDGKDITDQVDSVIVKARYGRASTAAIILNGFKLASQIRDPDVRVKAEE